MCVCADVPTLITRSVKGPISHPSKLPEIRCCPHTVPTMHSSALPWDTACILRHSVTTRTQGDQNQSGAQFCVTPVTPANQPALAEQQLTPRLHPRAQRGERNGIYYRRCFGPFFPVSSTALQNLPVPRLHFGFGAKPWLLRSGQ